MSFSNGLLESFLFLLLLNFCLLRNPNALGRCEDAVVYEADAYGCCGVYLVGCTIDHVDQFVILLLQLAVLGYWLPYDLVFFIHLQFN